MTNLARRGATALAKVLGESTPRTVDLDFHVLCLALSRMLSHNDDRCYLTASHVESITGVSHPTAVASINRLIALGVVEDITGTDAGDSLRARTGLWRNARVVRLSAQAFTQTGSADPAQGFTQTSIPQDAQALTQTTSAQGLTQIADTITTSVEVVSNSYISEGRLKQVMDTMDPGSPTWNRETLGSRSMRLYSFVAEAGQPVSTKRVGRYLAVRRARAEGHLRLLADAGLIEQTTGGWVLGRMRPCDLFPSSPVPSPSEAVETAHRPSQPQESVSMPECPDCPAYAEHGLPCPCESTPADYVPLTPRREPLWRWDIRGQAIAGPNGELDAWRLNGRDLDWVDGSTGVVRRPSVGPGGCPPNVWEAFKKETT